MKYIEFKKIFEKMPVFSLSDIHTISPAFHRQQLTQWLKKGYIQKLKKGFYFFSDRTIDDEIFNHIANKIYSPSYVSLELALSRYEFIPESVYGITSVSSRKTQTIVTPVGTFIYRHIKPELMFGYELRESANIHYKLAFPEKAILDFLYLNSDLHNPAAIEEMRFNTEEIQAIMDWNRCEQYLDIFQSQQLRKRFNLFKEHVTHAEYDRN